MEKIKFMGKRIYECLFRRLYFQGKLFSLSVLQYKSYRNIHHSRLLGNRKTWSSIQKNVSCGVSLVIDNFNTISTYKEQICKEAYIEKRTIQEAIAEQTNLKNPIPRHPNRNKAIALLMNPNITLKEFSKACDLPWK